MSIVIWSAVLPCRCIHTTEYQQLCTSNLKNSQTNHFKYKSLLEVLVYLILNARPCQRYLCKLYVQVCLIFCFSSVYYTKIFSLSPLGQENYHSSSQFVNTFKITMHIKIFHSLIESQNINSSLKPPIKRQTILPMFL